LLDVAKLSSVVTLDPDFKAVDLDQPLRFPRVNSRPDVNQELLDRLPKVIYHSCDRQTMMNIIENGMVPGGWPRSTGRAHNYFITMPPWDANRRKLAGTRAGKQYYLPFDTELAERCSLVQDR